MGVDNKTSLPLFADSDDRSEILTEIRGIAQLVNQRKVQFLCGAGMSKASGCPLSEDLAVKMVTDAFGGGDTKELRELVRLFPLEAIAGGFLKKKDMPRLQSLLDQEINRGSGNSHDGHRALEYLADQGYLEKVYTTNFDQLLEDAFGGRGVCVTDDTADRIRKARETDQIPVIHLHGTLDGRKFRITEDETYRLDTPLALYLTSDMVTDWFVLVGYSLTDVDLRSMYFGIREILGRYKFVKRPYVVHPLTAQEVKLRKLELKITTAMWDARGATYIPLRAEEFLPELVKSVRTLEGDQVARMLAVKYGWNPDNEDDLKKVWDKARALKLGDELGALKALAQREDV